MRDENFFEHAVQHLPGGLILIDLQGRIRAVNQTAQTLLGLSGIEAGQPMSVALSRHPRIAGVLEKSCKTQTESNRQELETLSVNGEKMVLGYGVLALKDNHGRPLGMGMTFQDITRLIPLMDSHRFLDIALKNMPGGLIFVDLQGKIRGVNQTALRLLELKDDIETGTPCHQALATHPHVYKVILSTCESLQAANRKELVSRRTNGEPMTLGYGTLVLRNPQGQPVGIGLTFQDITRFIPLPLQTEFVSVIDRFFTPFAAAMVIAAMTLGYAEKWALHASLALITALVIFNEVSLWIARHHNEWTIRISYLRQAVNFLANVTLVYWLGQFWGPMWLLFVLTPVATAMHANWKKTAVIAALSAGTLLGIYYARDLSGPVGWGMAGIHASFIVFLSLFVNAIAKMVMQIKSAGPAKPQTATQSSKTESTSPLHKLAA